ncbi:hypothetical protein [Aquiflexum gelatinilyticum]|uniref:Carboxypeptidase-like regulatory domain-containing protein n=1 Tax=Aquiflexum gelatinilyticum TaxID=2961943 RepID=A0A9X2P6E5_9BACT|nr:hypothetical protein [Aquiflexum gelatinilyticum]
MKKFCLILFIFFASAQIKALSQVLTGNVLDGLDKGFLDKVWVINLQNKDSSLTNERGYFRVKAAAGDSILISKTYYIPKILIAGEEKHILTDIYLDARTLPRFDLYGESYVIPFKVGNQSTMRGLSDRPAGPGKIYAGLANNQSLQPGLTLDGPISYFMKSERQKRQYARKLAFLASQEDYLKLIQSDSVMAALKYEYNLTDEDLDGLIIEFNLQNIDHQFVGMEWERVEKLLIDFLDSRAVYKRKED